MVPIARKILFREKVRLNIALTGITFAIILIFFQIGIYLGFMQDAASYIINTDADIWIASKNCKTLDFSVPFSENKLYKVKGIDGVADADKLVMRFNPIKLLQGVEDDTILIGFNPDTKIGAPWQMKEGRIEDVKYKKSIIIDESSQKKWGGIKIGDKAEMSNKRIDVVGICKEATSFTANLVFTHYRTAQELLHMKDKISFILVTVKPGINIKRVVEQISKIGGVEVYTKKGFAWRTMMYWTFSTGMGIGFAVTALAGFIVGMVIVGQIIYNATIEHIREYGILKAIGGTNWDIYKIIWEQALIIAVLGYLMGLIQGMIAIFFYETFSGMKCLVPIETKIAMFFLTILMCLSASFISIRRITKIDPMIVFRT